MKPEGNTYLLDVGSRDEMARLLSMDRFLTKAVGGPLAAVPNVPEHARIVDLACGPGGWAIAVASQYPSSEVIGLDISQDVVDYARLNADVRRVWNISFALADVTKPLPFADETCDIVNARLLATVLLRDAWEPFIAECIRILRPQGVLQLTEGIDAGVTNSLAFEQMQELTSRMVWRAGYGFSVDGRTMDVSFMLPRLLRRVGYSDIQHTTYTLEFSADTDLWADAYHTVTIAYELGKPNFVKTGLASQEEFEDLYERMCTEMQRKDFCGASHIINIVARKP